MAVSFERVGKSDFFLKIRELRMLHLVSRAIVPAIAAIAFVSAPGLSQAAPLNAADIVTNWTAGNDPIEKGTSGAWSSSGALLTSSSNHRGSIVSDFTAIGDYSFSATANPGDNDTFGMVFGWQDIDNHYRISWSSDYGESGGNPNNINFGQNGFKIIKVANDVRTVLFSAATTYNNSKNYSLTVEGQTGGGFRVIAHNETDNAGVTNQLIADTMFTSGKVGFFHLYQENSNWFDIDFTQGTVSAVPVPFALPLMATGLGLLGFVGRRKAS